MRERQTDKQTNRHRQTDRQRERERCKTLREIERANREEMFIMNTKRTNGHEEARSTAVRKLSFRVRAVEHWSENRGGRRCSPDILQL